MSNSYNYNHSGHTPRSEWNSMPPPLPPPQRSHQVLPVLFRSNNSNSNNHGIHRNEHIVRFRTDSPTAVSSNSNSNNDWSRMPPPPPLQQQQQRGYQVLPIGNNHSSSSSNNHHGSNHNHRRGYNASPPIMPPPPPPSRWEPSRHYQQQQHQDRNSNTDDHRKRPSQFNQQPQQQNIDFSRHYQHHQAKRHCSSSSPALLERIVHNTLRDNTIQQERNTAERHGNDLGNNMGTNSNHGTTIMSPPLEPAQKNNNQQSMSSIKQEHSVEEAAVFEPNNHYEASTIHNDEASTRIKQEEEEEGEVERPNETNNKEKDTVRIKEEEASRVRQHQIGSSQDVIDLSLDDSDDEEEDGDRKMEAPSQTHIVFAIDFSGSMRTKDVKGENGQLLRRWDAVFLCINDFLQDQLSTNEANGTALVSVLIFNDKAETLLERMPLVGDGQKVLKALKTAQKMHTPRSGTGFAAGFERAKLLATENTNGKRDPKNNNVVLVFLSDGRPGDLQFQPPSREPMQETFKRNKHVYPSAKVHIEAMQQEHGARFSLQLICLADEGRPWLEYLAQQFGGNFHKPNLTLDEDDSTNGTMQPPAAASLPRNCVSEDGSDNMFDDADENEDEVLEMVVKSRNTLIREKFNRARAAGNIVSLTNTTTSERSSSSMRSTFQSISSVVTAMRQGGKSRLQERRVVLVQNSPMMEFLATRMVLVLDAEREKIAVASGEQADGRRVRVSMHPFAQGGLRNVYRMKQSGNRQQVAKESRHDIKYQERLKFHFETAKCQAKAQTYAKAFNKKLKKGKVAVERIQFLKTEVYRLKDSNYPGGFRYLGVEDEMKGDYVKWNGNNGYVKDDGSLQCHMAHAFSHFTYENSNQKEMVVDIQGTGFTYTDPQLHSRGQEFGRADRGTSGFDDFFMTHMCNDICKGLGLKNRSKVAAMPLEVKFERN